MYSKSFAVGQRWLDQHGRRWLIQSFNLNPQDDYQIRARCEQLIGHMATVGYFDRHGHWSDRDITLERRLS